MNISVLKQVTEILIAPIDAAQSEPSSLISNSSLFTLALTRFLQFTVAIFKGPESVLKGIIPVLETVQTRLVLKRPQRALNRRTLDRYHRALDSWSQRALDRVLECSRLLSDSGPWAGLRKTWNRSQRALNVVSEGPGAVSEEPKVCEPI